jgi:hypothetical protein
MREYDRVSRGRRQQGFALVLALLSLLLLTVLGLTLAATTTTEIQIATNYKWSQQALANAEAGVELGKRVLRTMDWAAILPPARTAIWHGPNAPCTSCVAPTLPGVPFTGATRNFENAGCDRTAGVGYGVVLNDGNRRYENVSAFPDVGILPATVNGIDTRILGAFTLWVRRPIVTNPDGSFTDSEENNDLILTSEGTAPFTQVGNAFAAVNRAVRVMEVRVSQVPRGACGARNAQAGSSQSGAGYANCAMLGPDPLGVGGGGGPASGGGAGTGSGIDTGGR